MAKILGFLTLIGIIFSSFFFIDSRYALSDEVRQLKQFTMEEFRAAKISRIRNEIKRLEYAESKGTASALDKLYKKELERDYKEVLNAK